MRFAIAFLLLATVCQAQELDKLADDLLDGKSEQTRNAAAAALLEIASQHAEGTQKLTDQQIATLRPKLLKAFTSAKELQDRHHAVLALRPFVDDSCRKPLLAFIKINPKRDNLPGALRGAAIVTLTPIADDSCLPIARVIVLEQQAGADAALELIASVGTPAAKKLLEEIAKDAFWKETAARALEQFKAKEQ